MSAPDAKYAAAVAEAKKTLHCNCDLDNWEPESDTGHSWVCRIHKAAKQAADERRPSSVPVGQAGER